jgi:hypothetical protein
MSDEMDEEKAGNVGSKHTRVWAVNARQDVNCEDTEVETDNRMVTRMGLVKLNKG